MRKVSKSKLVELYTQMLRIRKTEEKLIDVFSRGEILGFLHVSIGQEAAPVGVCAHLRGTDYISTTHRGHGYAIAKGIDLKLAMAELFGKKEGICLGRSGSMHLADAENGIMGANGIVGAGIPIATGAAFAAQYKKTDQVAVATFGEGATSEGAFHEALNFAAIKKLPIVYVCENNGWAEFSPQSVHMPIKDVVSRAASYDMRAVQVDNDVLEIYEAAREAVAHARSGKGPTLLEVRCDRWSGHYVGDAQKYRGKEAVEKALQWDCILRLKNSLLTETILHEEDIARIDAQIQSEVEEAVDFARECSFPNPCEMSEGLYI